MLSLYNASVPPLKHALNNLSHILKIAEKHANDKEIEHDILLNARLFPDMFPIIRQVHIATDMSKGCAARLANIDVPQYDDTETTFDELQARISKTIIFLNLAKPEQFNDAGSRSIVMTVRKRTLEFNASDYLLLWVLPNVHFHITTTYDILRHNGVVLGKPDFLGLINQPNIRIS